VAVGGELEVDDGAAVSGREHVEVVALPVHVPQDWKNNSIFDIKNCPP
jgi:hypothetical protein